MVGPNGSGKTSLVELALLQREPTQGSVQSDLSKIGVIEQGAANWMLEDSLLTVLQWQSAASSSEVIASWLHAHRFPFALAERPLASLSAGERTRAALIGLCHRDPPVQVLVLDEPTHSLDLLGVNSLEIVLRQWRGGLLVVSHDDAFLDAVGVDRRIDLSARESR